MAVASNSGFRTSQYVRSQVIWSTTPTLSVPVTAVQRINGQYFVFVAESNAQPAGAGTPGAMLIAKQRPVNLGNVIGNDYVVLDGLKEGDTLIVSGVQKVGDGAPVAAAQPAAPATPPAAERK